MHAHLETKMSTIAGPPTDMWPNEKETLVEVHIPMHKKAYSTMKSCRVIIFVHTRRIVQYLYV